MTESKFSKITVTALADKALSRSLEVVNQGFEGGRVTKMDLASWIIQNSGNNLDSATIKKIREAHFNQVAYLENLVKRLKASDQEQIGPEERKAFQAILGMKPEARQQRSKLTTQPPKEKSDSMNSKT